MHRNCGVFNVANRVTLVSFVRIDKTVTKEETMTRRTSKIKTRVAARVQMQGGRCNVKPIEIEVMVVDKVIPNVLVDGGSGLNILREHIMKRLGISLTGPSRFIINMANQSPAVPLGMIKDYRINTVGKEYVVTFHIINMHTNKKTFSILLGRHWLKMSNAIVDWGEAKPSIIYNPKDNRVKVSIGLLGGWVRKEIVSSSEDGKNNEALIKVLHSGGHGGFINLGSGFLVSSFYHYMDNGDYAQWVRKYHECKFDVMVTSHHACLSDDILVLIVKNILCWSHVRCSTRMSGFKGN